MCIDGHRSGSCGKERKMDDDTVDDRDSSIFADDCHYEYFSF